MSAPGRPKREFLSAQRAGSPVSGAEANQRSRRLGHGWPLGAIAALICGALVFALVWTAAPLHSGYRHAAALDQARYPTLAAPADLRPADLKHFAAAHPRLPHPQATELDRLRAENPGFLAERARLAERGDREAGVLTELAEPGSLDLERLHARLLALQFEGRGHVQVKPLAVAYDWLFHRWSPAQRAALAAKLISGCHYTIDYIRNERLSPYNVILYNAPFQALMACAIAVYRDDPRGEPIMAFAHDLWKNRVLPVWRQVMGRNGGWHEGAEYVGIGIGAAVYQVPAMWRAATGEDVFRSEAPMLRGFLDFLVYRTQPDGSHLRSGDAAFFDRVVPDASALALHYRHAAAYSLRQPSPQPVPTSWPWGPLTDASLYDPSAIAQLPLYRHFDGIGLVVARSGWNPDATYVTFKAGDNYWSHVHLDQGAFTIYKSVPLAIDSGQYGPRYGSDHHMNYTYQTIAHNAITVTDPDDTVPMPPRKQKDPPRPIANDGGQRRIGSGWGIEPAPLDREEWEQKRSVYHTGKIVSLTERDGVVIAAADITPAYTNGMSGSGTFSHRTRRVEKLWRVFGYDRANDIVVVFDLVRSTRSEYRKRWLLHSLTRPTIGADGFQVGARVSGAAGSTGGQLLARVVLPKQRTLNAIGGKRFEFFVDGKNYDDDGQVAAAPVTRADDLARPLPGAWRIELMPENDAREDRFLVVMRPVTAPTETMPAVKLLEAERAVGVEIAGPVRARRWWFSLERPLGRVESP